MRRACAGHAVGDRGRTYQIGVGGDLIVAADGQPMTSNDALQRVLSRKRGGDTLTLTVYRGGRKLDVAIKTR